MKEITCEYSVEGMHCAACELTVEKKLRTHPLVKSVDAKLSEQKVVITIKKDNISQSLREELNALIRENGYALTEERYNHKVSKKELAIGFGIATIFAVFFVAIQTLDLSAQLNPTAITLPFMFVLGIVASLSSCMAVVGGLVLSLSSQFGKEKKVVPLLGFHIARILTFFILGAGLGYIGSQLGSTLLPFAVTFTLNFAIFLFMVLIGLNMLDISPSLRKFQPKLPKKVSNNIINNTYISVLGSVLLGALTFILPCGFTQAAQGLALKSGSTVMGSLYMGAFVLGTFPALGLISFTSVTLSKSLQSGLFFKTAGFMILFFALYNFYNALVAAGIISLLR